MFLELVRATTCDGVRLDGSLRLPEESSQAPAAILVHGTASNFYSSTLMDAIERGLVQRGLAVLRINTRGHDGISTAVTSEGSRRLGAAYELIDECRHDLAAWIDLASSRRFSPVMLVGHSLGALKSIYGLAREHWPAVERLIAISPPRLSYSSFQSEKKAARFVETFGRAKSLVESGRGEELLEIDFPLPYVVSARGYVDKYGPDERYNVLKHFDQVRVPSLVLFGSLEVQHNPAFRQLPEQIERLAAEHGLPCQVGILAGADHFYAGAREELLARIERWLQKP
jgi:pimeloyl-ACP methyl ester carboxylesterase